MHRVWLPALLLSFAFAQEPSDLFHKAPPDVDEALRARITEFYQDHVDGKYRQAESLVAEDSKDYYYNANKPKYLGFNINRIDYTDDFTKAKVTMVCEMYVMVPGFADKPLQVPTPSRWKLVNGQWYWYVDQQELRMTPFGKMTPGTVRAGGVDLSKINTNPDVAPMVNRVQVDKADVKLKPEEGSTDQVVVVNHMPGVVSFSFGGPTLESVEMKLDPQELKTGQKAVLRFRYKPGHSPMLRPATIELRVNQTNQVIPIRITVAQP